MNRRDFVARCAMAIGVTAVAKTVVTGTPLPASMTSVDTALTNISIGFIQSAPDYMGTTLGIMRPYGMKDADFRKLISKTVIEYTPMSGRIV